MIEIKVHEKDTQITKSLSLLVKNISKNLGFIVSLTEMINIYKTSHPEYIPILEAIRADYKKNNNKMREWFFSTIRSFLLDESPAYQKVMRKEVCIEDKKVLVVDHIMLPLTKLFEKLFSNVQYPDQFVAHFKTEDLQGLDMLSIDLGIKRLIIELESFEKPRFILVCTHDPEELTITLGWKK